MTNSKTKRIVISALFAALTCVATMIIQIPTPMKGYLNLGDCIVLLSAWCLPNPYGIVAAGLGSAMADVLSSYSVYAPATFIIKGLMAFVTFYGVKLMGEKIGKLPSRIISGAVAEIIMILGYFVYEGFLKGEFISPMLGIPGNALQGVAGLVLGVILITLLEKSKIKFD